MPDEPPLPVPLNDDPVVGATDHSDANRPHVVFVPDSFSMSDIPRLVAAAEACPPDCEVYFDLRKQRFATPTLMVVLRAYREQLRRIGIRAVALIDEALQSRSCYRYLHRMDFFTIGGQPATASPHDSTRSAVPVREIGPTAGASGETEKIATELADTILDFGDLARQGLLFCFGELINNVVQHSCSTGFVCAQYYPTSERIRISIADGGIGIRESLRRNPAYHELADDGRALGLAIRRGVTGNPQTASPYHHPVNSGNGLFMLSQISRKGRGVLWLYSYSGILIALKGGPVIIRKAIPFPGTIVELIVDAPRADNFRSVLAEIVRDTFGDEVPPIRFG